MKVDLLQDYSEKHLLLRMPFFDEPGQILVDVGAFRGYFSRTFAVRGWRVLAFEPESENYLYCQRSLKKFPHAICVKKAVSDTSKKEANFYVSPDLPGIHSLKHFHPTHHRTTIDTITLNDALEEFGIDRISLLKVDTEGADFLVVKGLNFNIYSPDIVMVEFYDERSLKYFGYTQFDILEYMKSFGYKGYVSEWAKFDNYGNARSSNSHRFIGCQPYPIQHQPTWGNQIFVKKERVVEFESTLERYISDLDSYKSFRVFEWYRKTAKRFPFLRVIVNRIRGFE